MPPRKPQPSHAEPSRKQMPSEKYGKNFASYIKIRLENPR